MMRLILCLSVLAAPPAMADAFTDMLAADDSDQRVTGLVGVCAFTAHYPEAGLGWFEGAGWTRADEFDGSASFQSGDDYAMFSLQPGFCMFETPRMGTDALAALLPGMQAVATGTDGAGCATYSLPELDAAQPAPLRITLTGGGNDPACTSDTEAALRFEVVQ